MADQLPTPRQRRAPETSGAGGPQKTAKRAFEILKDVERYLYWSLDPEDNKDGGAYNCQNLIDNAHALVDEGHPPGARS